MGLGIALSGTTAALAPEGAGFGPPWLVLAAVAALLGVAPWRRLATAGHGAPAAAPAAGSKPDLGFGRLAAAYFLEGFGYIVSGTFAVAAVRRTPGLESLAPWTWVLTGLAAAPSAVLWSRLGGRHGARRVLALAYLVQAVGMALPSLSRSPAAALAGAALFGGTFMGITTLALAAGRTLAPGLRGAPSARSPRSTASARSSGRCWRARVGAAGDPASGRPGRRRRGRARRPAPRPRAPRAGRPTAHHPHRGGLMPYVNIKITREGATAEQKAELIRGVTELLRDKLGKNPATTVVVIEEVETDNWGIGGETVTVRRRRGS